MATYFLLAAAEQVVSFSPSALLSVAAGLAISALGFAAWVVKQLMEVSKVIAVLVNRADATSVDIDQLRAELHRFPSPKGPR